MRLGEVETGGDVGLDIAADRPKRVGVGQEYRIGVRRHAGVDVYARDAHRDADDRRGSCARTPRRCGRPVACLHARSATSLASEPACPRYTRRSPLPGTSASRSSARPTESGWTADRPPEPGIVRTARLTASTTAGWPCPSPDAVQVADRSSSSRPSGVTRVEPWPDTTSNGKKRSFSIPAMTASSRS